MVGPDSISLPDSITASVLYSVRDLSSEGSSATMVPAGIGPSSADTADAPLTAALSRPRHPFVPPVSQSVSQGVQRSAAPYTDHCPAQACLPAPLIMQDDVQGHPRSSLTKELVFTSTGRKSSGSTPAPFNELMNMETATSSKMTETRAR